MSNYASPAQVKHNRSLWGLYPLGMLTAMWGMLESLHSYLTPEERDAIKPVLEALEKFDALIRRRRHPMPKRRRTA